MSRQWFKAMRLLIVVAMLVTVVVVQLPQPSQALDDPTYWPTNGWQTSMVLCRPWTPHVL